MNYRPVSLLSVFSKVYEKVLKESLVSGMNEYASNYISAYRANYSTQHVLIRLLEEWREHLDNDEKVGAVLMDLSKAFNCIPHNLLIAKLDAYGFGRDIVEYVYSYLENRKQCVKINNTKSDFKYILSGVPQGSIVGPILFNLFLKDFFTFIESASIHNFADDNTISSSAQNIANLRNTLELESDRAISWFESNSMIVNPDKFQLIMLSKHKNLSKNYEISIKGENNNSSSLVKLLGVHIDDRLNFDFQINKICKSASNQLNALIRMNQFLGFEEKKSSYQ